MTSISPFDHKITTKTDDFSTDQALAEIEEKMRKIHSVLKQLDKRLQDLEND